MAFSVSINGNGADQSQDLFNTRESLEPYDAKQLQKDFDERYLSENRIVAKGSNSASLHVGLPANAIVDQYLVEIKAARANYSKASLAGELRQSNSEPTEVIVDFGKMLTVNAIRIPYIVTDYHAYSWLGAKFDLLNDAHTQFKSRPVTVGKVSTTLETYIFSQEIRTERLLLVFPDNIDFEFIQKNLELSLPDLPSDLSISINGGAPVWQHQGLVQPGTRAVVGQAEWSSAGTRLVSLSEAMQTLAGDASNNALLPLTIELKSKTPGDIAITFNSRSIRLLHRFQFEKQQEISIDFAMEGALPLRIYSPSTAEGKPKLLGVQLTLAADFPQQRAVPAISEAANGASALVLGKGKAACVRLDNIDELAQISAIRLPLASMSSRVEARLVLWQGDEFNPSEALENGVSDPVSWSGGNSAEHWHRFGFAEPIAHSDGDRYWMALIVERGEVNWKLADANANGDYAVRLGAPAGPWRALPSIFNTSSALNPVAARLHVLGSAAEYRPLAPLQLSLDQGNQIRDVSPTAQGEDIQLAINSASDKSIDQAELAIVSRAVGRVTLSKVSVITEEITV